MHVKQIIISNFRSFRSQTEITPFSPHMNALVGRNGSGKSNLFDAVQFVLLSPKFYTLRTEERQALLHEGSGAAAVNAFVEIVFDNSDNRFNMDSASDEVVLRRTIGHKKDEFFLQRKRAQKSEIMSLLEGAGFSKSNPYFIVQQGKVNALCTMSDEERLNLLKEVAGTTVYDEKKAESLGKMHENETDIQKINEMLGYIDERLTELEGEKEELTAYQKLDRSRRAVEYTLYDKELRKARETVDDIEHLRAEEAKKLSQLHEESHSIHDAVRNVETNMKQTTHAIRRIRVQMSSLEEAKLQKMTARTKLEVEYRELEEFTKQKARTEKENAKELQQILGRIEKTSSELDNEVNPKYENTRSNLNKILLEKEETVKKIDALYAKQNRGKSFSSRLQRDKYLNTQIKDLQQTLKDKQNLLQSKIDSLTTCERKIETESKFLSEKKSAVMEKQHLSSDLLKVLQEKKCKRNELADIRREHWRSIDDLQERLSEVKEDDRRKQFEFRKTTPRATSLGLQALEQIVRAEGIPRDKYMGTVMENFDLKDESFQTAVEVAAGNSLHHVIVDTDATAAHLMRKLERGKLGRVTFLPLNQLNIPNINYPDSPDITPLLSRCLNYHPRIDRAMKHVFGKKLLARNVEVASQWSLNSDMDAITLAGDLCSRKGALTGGFVDTQKSKLRLYHQQLQSRQEIEKLSKELDTLQRQNNDLDQEVASVMSDMQKDETQRVNINHDLQRLQDELSSLDSRIQRRKQHIEETREDIPILEGECQGLTTQITSLNAEKGTALTSQLSDEEKQVLEGLKISQKALETTMEGVTHRLEEISLKRKRLQTYLEDNLLKRKTEIEDELQKSHFSLQDDTVFQESRQRQNLQELERELENTSKQESEVEKTLEETKTQESILKTELISLKNELEKLRVKDTKTSQALQEATETGDRLLNKRSMHIGKREMYMRKIQELGSLPSSNELSSHSGLSIPSLMKKLEKINKDLKKYSHVNKKAFDQFVTFNEQREQLLVRKQELDDGAEKVRELVESLDQQKDEAINRTFRGVSSHFKDVFKELVPNGSGELIMKTSIPGDEVSDDEGEDEELGQMRQKGKKAKKKKGKKDKTPSVYDSENPIVSLYKGVGIKVRFTPIGENFIMSQLSGGQKALVALALIFAIQRCDPAPFYLFDELDQALDSTYRAAVASVIQRQANNEDNPTQFVCSTFRPELVAAANSCYGISHQNKVSNLHLLSKQEALHFIANLMSEEEAVQEVSTIPSKKSTVSKSKRHKKQKRVTVNESDDADI